MTTERRRRFVTTLLTVKAMAAELDDYFARNELFRQLIIHTPWGDELPTISLGGLVERLRFLEAHREALSAEEQEDLAKARQAYEEAVRLRGKEVENRFRREFKSYLHSWEWYLDELKDTPEKAADYAAEVHNRVRLTTLLEEAKRLKINLGEDLRRQLEALDAWLYQHWQPGAFVWTEQEPDDFDPQTYWYLYGQPKV